MEKGKLRSNIVKRKRNSVIVFNAEGVNKTECIYLNNYSSRNLRIRLAKGNSTDPIGMYNELVKYCKEEDIKKEYGDKIYLFLDTDLRNDKIESIKKLIEKNNDEIELVISVPTFEIWYLNHFRYSSKEYINNKCVLDDLEKYISNYSKSDNYFNFLKDKTCDAIKNSIMLEEYHKNNNSGKEFYECNPYTNVYKVVEEIIELNNSINEE